MSIFSDAIDGITQGAGTIRDFVFTTAQEANDLVASQIQPTDAKKFNIEASNQGKTPPQANLSVGISTKQLLFFGGGAIAIVGLILILTRK